MKFNLFTKSILIAIIGFALAYGFYQLSDHFLDKVNPKDYFNGSIKTAENRINSKIIFNNIDNLEVQTTKTDIVMVPSKTLEGAMEFSSEGNQMKGMRIQKINRTLIVNVHPHSNQSIIRFKLPSSVKNIKIMTTSGDVTVKQQKLALLSILATSADINLDQVTAVQNHLQTTAGDINWIGNSHFADIQTVAGDVNFSLTNPFSGKISTQTVSGKVVVPHLSPTGKDLIDIKTVSGDIHIEYIKQS